MLLTIQISGRICRRISITRIIVAARGGAHIRRWDVIGGQQVRGGDDRTRLFLAIVSKEFYVIPIANPVDKEKVAVLV